MTALPLLCLAVAVALWLRERARNRWHRHVMAVVRDAGVTVTEDEAAGEVAVMVKREAGR